MDITVAIGTERDQIFVGVVTQPAPRAEVVDLETIGTAAVLASPAVTLQKGPSRSLGRRGWKLLIELSPLAARIPISVDPEATNKVD